MINASGPLKDTAYLSKKKTSMGKIAKLLDDIVKAADREDYQLIKQLVKEVSECLMEKKN